MCRPDVSVMEDCVGVFPDGPKKAEVAGGLGWFVLS